jgi:hypothetical protein
MYSNWIIVAMRGGGKGQNFFLCITMEFCFDIFKFKEQIRIYYMILQHIIIIWLSLLVHSNMNPNIYIYTTLNII